MTPKMFQFTTNNLLFCLITDYKLKRNKWTENCDSKTPTIGKKEAASIEDCTLLCWETSRCTHFTWNKETNISKLKSGKMGQN